MKGGGGGYALQKKKERKEKKITSDEAYSSLIFLNRPFQLFGKIAWDRDTEIHEDNHFRNLLQALQVLFR